MSTSTKATIPVRRGLARATAGQRDRVRAILRECPGLADSGGLALVYGQHRAAEAAWLCAQARANGVRVRLLPVPATPPKAAQHRAGQEAGAGVPVIVLADAALDLPATVLHLPGTADISPVDLWRPRPVLDEATDALIRSLGREPVIVTGGQRLRVVLGTVTRGRPAGTVDATVTGTDGTFVADGAIAVNRDVNWDARLAGRAVRVGMARGRVVSVDCADPHLGRLLRRAVHIHGADQVVRIRFGAHPAQCGYSAVAGPVNIRRQSAVTLCLRVEPGRAYSTASDDLCVELTGTRQVIDL